MEKPRILFVLHLPPPMHGAAAVGETIRASARIADAFETRFINLSASEELGQIGKFSLKKIFRIRDIRRAVRKAVRDFSPDLVYMTPTAAMPAFLKDLWIARPVLRRHIPMVTHLHNKGYGHYGRKAWARRSYRRLFDHAETILLAERLYADVATILPWDRVHICPNGVDAGPAPERHPSTEKPQILFLGNMISSKGVLTLLDACGILHREAVPFRCIFVGKETPEITRQRFAAWVEERQLEECVSYLGPLYGTQKQEAYAGSDLFVFPTAYPYEAFPLVLLEAMAAGLPCVATPEGGIPDIIEDGVTGIVCGDYRPETLAAALKPLLADADLRARMGTAGRARYEAQFTRDAFERRMVSILKYCIRNHERND